MFQKRHYEAIAHALNCAYHGLVNEEERRGVREAELYLGIMFGEDNPKFNIFKFMNAIPNREGQDVIN